MNPKTIYQRYRAWREEKQKKCVVTINKPKMRIKGKLIEGKSGFDCVAFLGIPYALPPIGPLRFAPPQPLPRKPFCIRAPLHEAYEQRDRCLQYQVSAEAWIGSEDCLYLNVFIPTKPENNLSLLPVIIFIHGGAFKRGSCNGVDPSLLVAAEECVVVTLHYRLSLLGFLNMRTDNCRGNAGLKDQVEALKWVRDNIEPFGGDPHNVTIAGQSSGGTSVNLHMISPLSKGLFHKAIIQSGGIYCPWGCGDHVYTRTAKLFQQNGRIIENELRDVLVKSFKSVSGKDFLKFSSKITTNHVIQIEEEKMKIFLLPSVEYIQEDAFLPDTAENLMLTAEPVPTIAGITKEDGYLFYRAMPDDADPVSFVRDDEKFKEFLKIYLRWCDESIERFSPKIRATYFPHENMSDMDIRDKFATLITDISFRRFYDNFNIGNLSRSEPPALYIYEFDYFLGEPLDPSPEKDGVCIVDIKASEHGDDLAYVLGVYKIINVLAGIADPKKRYETLQRTFEVIYHMCELWASFCRDGLPECLSNNVKWRHHTQEDPCYMRIGETLSMQPGRLNQQRWGKLNVMCQLNKRFAST